MFIRELWSCFLDVVTFSVPAYKTYKAIEGEDIEEVQGMLVYWCVHAVIQVLESLSDIFMGDMQYYKLNKAIFLFVLVRLIGPFHIYNFIILPIFKANEKRIDKVVEKTKERVKTIAKKAYDRASDKVISFEDDLAQLAAKGEQLGINVDVTFLQSKKAMKSIGVKLGLRRKSTILLERKDSLLLSLIEDDESTDDDDEHSTDTENTTTTTTTTTAATTTTTTSTTTTMYDNIATDNNAEQLRQRK